MKPDGWIRTAMGTYQRGGATIDHAGGEWHWYCPGVGGNRCETLAAAKDAVFQAEASIREEEEPRLL